MNKVADSFKLCNESKIVYTCKDIESPYKIDFQMDTQNKKDV